MDFVLKERKCFSNTLLTLLHIIAIIIMSHLILELHFVAVEGKEVHSGNIEDVPIKEKSKFPQDFFPEVVYQLYYLLHIILLSVEFQFVTLLLVLSLFW